MLQSLEPARNSASAFFLILEPIMPMVQANLTVRIRFRARISRKPVRDGHCFHTAQTSELVGEVGAACRYREGVLLL
ncbi:hypothetical protein BCR37DRAFT_378420 [Protomyces lactucae-debilis]|uniref:Uncharacterized protein n=1 Tax=Protomyces lactucae-debilis TaxID=2754530 RepID=A0A1Y2FNV2_PROLT|nr:uncharacterized protein BCR37DRAFT_378420 [Protomyces lactucae-debilis]ORY84395.1 hypothetical protein BCR37DRAFT_378420 [Protomyces lactucae-debilis]